MITKIYLVRHTQTVGNIEHRFTGRDKFEITDDGYKYIDLLTERLKNIKFDKAYSSVSYRAVKTIEKLAKLNNIEINTSDKLCEMYFGIYEGKRWDEVNVINPQIKIDKDRTNEIMGIPGQESSQDVADRMYSEIRDLSIKNLGKTILICSHGVAIEAFIRKITKVPFTQMIQEYSQKNTTINILEYNDEEDIFKLIVLNDYSHIL